MSRVQSDAAAIYVEACNREHAECALEVVQSFESREKELNLSDRSVQLNDVDVSCIAEALRSTAHSIRVLNLEGNAFGLSGLQMLLEAVEKNPGTIRELRLGRNKLKDQAAVVIGHTLSRDGCGGLKVLDLSENDITKLGVIPIAAALGDASCDIVELSFHNNKIEADAATYLAQAIRHASKLRHLHLGYNAIRDTGATQLAQCIPLTVNLSTLDLTANRIGPSGGKELAHALMSSSCNIQRLNLRHNLFDSETIEMYADVLQTNTSLIQLFLGFMNPTPECAAVVLSALRSNRNLLLLDIYGWKLNPDVAWKVIDSIQKTNTTVAAIVTDACQHIAKRIDEGNDDRDERGMHPVYVGPDDRDAYVATKSLRRFSLAQSRRQSRASSRAGIASRTGSASSRRANERSQSCKDSDVHSRQSSRAPQEVSYQSSREGLNRIVKEEPQSSRRTMSVPRENTPYQLDNTSDSDMKQIVEQLRRELAEQRRVQTALERRVAILEKRRECKCECHTANTADRAMPLSRTTTGGGSGNGRESHNHNNNGLNNVHSSRGTYVYSNNAHEDVYASSEGAAPPLRPSSRSGAASLAEAIVRSKSTESYLVDLKPNGIGRSPSARGGRTASVTSGGVAEPLQTSVARTERSQPPAEPLELPAEQRPAGAVLQKSKTPSESYQPRLAPSPSKDRDPPRRKGSFHAL